MVEKVRKLIEEGGISEGVAILLTWNLLEIKEKDSFSLGQLIDAWKQARKDSFEIEEIWDFILQKVNKILAS